MKLITVALLLWALAAEAPFAAKIEAIEPPAQLATAQRKLLDPRPLVVRRGAEPVMRVWFRREIPITGTPQQLKKDPTYRQIPEGTWVGAIELPGVFVDYRNQRLPPGIYTLRFAIQPDTGEHTGTSPHPEFFLLSPAGEDGSTSGLGSRRLIELSSKVNQGRHPAVLLLWPNPAPDLLPKVTEQENGIVVATFARMVTAGKRKALLGISLTLAGSWKQ